MIIPDQLTAYWHKLFFSGIRFFEWMTKLCLMENTPMKWRDAFTFTRSELRGFRILTFLLMLIIICRLVYFRFIPPPVFTFSVPPAWACDDSSAHECLQPNESESNGNSYSSHRSRNQRDTTKPREYGAVFKRSRMVELNSADTLELRSLPAIGPYLARKISDYREKLGGFYSVDQLLEVYRLTPGKLDTIRPFLLVDTTLVRRIPINTVTLDQLLPHPYLSRSQTRGLLAYREKHGPFARIEDLKKCLLIDENTFGKLRDYVEVR